MTRTARSLGIMLGVVLVAATVTAVAQSPSGTARTIRHSDVVFMYDAPDKYEAYGCTVLGWAGRANAEHIERAHAAGVRQFSSSVGFLTEFRGAIDFDENFIDGACRNFAGEPFIVPWLWDDRHKHKGQPAWWWCTNSPLYRRYLDSRLKQVAAAKPDGLHIDDYRGTSGSVTWRSGGFCRHCMAAFREYLAKHVSKEKLAAAGVDDLATFDYREFLLAKGVKPEDYNGRRASLPLAGEFYDFHVTTATAFVAEYRRRAEELRGKPLSLCVNSGLSNPQALAIAPHLSYFCCEVGQHAAGRKVPGHPIYVYKLADGLGRPITATASGQDWAYVMEHKLPGLVRTWIALSYAYGHNFMAPHRQWCYTKEKGTHWYDGPTDEYAWPYRFVRSHARLLDGYEAVAPVAVVYDNAARRKGQGNIEPICTDLAERNVPFTVVVAGDNWLDYRLDAERLKQFRAVVVTEPLQMDSAQRELIDEVRNAGRLVVWPDRAGLDKLVPAPVVVDGSQHVGVVVRAKPGKGDAAVAVHLLNRQYDGQTDSMTAQADVTVRLRRDILDGRTFGQAVLHTPRQEPVSLAVTSDDQHVTVKIRKLQYWGIVELTVGQGLP
ncbi:MAG: hypothetical protein HQ567_35525 [Candidatus Nealsonbacteria bacterium]|nr:hypothetical protein [Candidatus Nealsonbacteria bacterium]